MNRYDFQIKYTTSYFDNYGTKWEINPLHSETEGSMITTAKGYEAIGTNYTLRVMFDNLFFGWGGKEFLFHPTEVGFDLFSGETGIYSLTEIK